MFLFIMLIALIIWILLVVAVVLFLRSATLYDDDYYQNRDTKNKDYNDFDL